MDYLWYLKAANRIGNKASVNRIFAEMDDPAARSLAPIPAEPVFYNVPVLPLYSTPSQQPRIVQNIMSPRYVNYYKNALSDWGDVPAGTAAITWGFDVDGGQWFEANSTAGILARVYAFFSTPIILGRRYIISFTVDSLSGIMANGNASFGVQAASLTITSTGRYSQTFVASVTGSVITRLGIGTDNVNVNTAAIRFSNIMVEQPGATRTYPYEYVNPYDQRAFPYSYTTTVVANKVAAPTLGPVYTIDAPTTSITIGDSFTNDVSAINPPPYGDFPYQARRFLPTYDGINSRGVSGGSITDTEAQLLAILAETSYTVGVSPYLVCVNEGGIINISAGQTLAQIQAFKLSLIAVIIANGMVPLIVGCTPWNGTSAANKAMILSYNAWLATLGYPFYNPYPDANDGTGNLKLSWGSPDGLHPGTGPTEGSAVMGLRVAQMLKLMA